MIAFDSRIDMRIQDRNKIVLFQDGTISDRPDSGYLIYRPFMLKAGESIHFSCAYVSDDVAILSEVDVNGIRHPLIQGKGAISGTNAFDYQATRDVTLQFNCLDLYDNDCTLTITRTPQLAQDLKPGNLGHRSANGLWNRLMQGVVKVAYSETGLLINTREQYLSASLLGFNAQKADMELTQDRQIVMCHDKGITFNEHGRSTTFDRNHNTPIATMTREQFCQIPYETDLAQYGHYPLHTDLDSFLRICKDTHIIPYLTIRDHNVDETLPVLRNTLQKYNLQDNCIISSFPPNLENIAKCKAYLPNAAYVLVHAYTYPLTRKLVDQCKALGNVLIQIQNEETVLNGSQDALQYARECGVPWGSYDIMNMEHYQHLVSMGCSMMQIYAPSFKENVRRLYLPLIFKNGTLELGGSIGYAQPPSYQADIQVDDVANTVKLKNIAYRGSVNHFPDALLDIWIAKLPILVNALGKTVINSYVDRETKEVVIRFFELPTDETVDLLISI